MNAAAFKSTAIYTWSRNRWALISLAAVYAVLLVNSLLVDSEVATFSGIGLLLLLAPTFAPAAILGTGNVATADLLSPESTFPKQFFHLPATPSQLVLPFMLYALVLSAIMWALSLAILDGKLIAIGTERSWLPIFSMSFMTLQQALAWTPVTNRIARLPQGIAPIVAYVVVLVAALNGTISAGAVVALSLMQFPLAYAVAVRGVARARCGLPESEMKASSSAAAAGPKASSRAMPELANPQHAMFWMERQMHRWVGKSGLIALVPAMLILIIVFTRLGGTADRDVEGLQTLGGITLTLLAITVILIGISTGLNVASFRPRMRSNESEAFQITSFLAALPLRADDFVWAKFKVGLANMLWVIGIALLVAIAVAYVSGLTDLWGARYESWIQAYGGMKAFARAFLPLAVILLFVLSITLSVMWIGLRGRGWTIAFGVACFLIVVAMLAALSLNRSRPGVISDWLPETLWGLAALKVVGLGVLILRTRSLHLLSEGRLATILGLWAATVAVIVGFCAICLPEGAVAPLTALCTGLVLAPVLGTVGAPLAMARNRVG